MHKTTTESRVWSPESAHTCTQRIIGRAREGNQPTLRAFADWLAEEWELAPSTVSLRVRDGSTFVDAATARSGTACSPALESLTPDDVEDFFVQHSEDRGMSSRRNMRAAMRLFLRFAASKGWVDPDLADTVPRLPSYRLGSLPRGLVEEELGTLLGSPWENQCPHRDRAIVFLLATYGVRREQVSALRLSDVAWKERTITFAAHKGGKAIHHTLTPAVSEALAEYLYAERPSEDGDESYVFLRHRSPHLRLSPKAVSDLVRARLVRCGLPPRGPHALRHAFATRLLRAGESFKVIADLLGHRSLAAVGVYAKVDHPRLLEVAAEWPEEVTR